MAPTEAELLARALADDDANAFGELVRLHQAAIRGFLTRMTHGDAAEADDLAQETFVKAWMKLRSYRNESKFSTWLFGIALNEFRMMTRRKKILTAEMPEILAPATDTPSLARLDLSQALQALNETERAALLLCLQNGLSHDEAARAMDCPIGTVKSLILRGKEKLRRQLPGYGFDTP